jgi:uncharacterized protein YndB with AHSA1/START domain
MTIAPIVRSVSVAVPPQRAFDLFTGRMGEWWTRGKTIGANPHVDVVIEPFEGGRWFERDAQGDETDWGKVLAWEPPDQVLLAWQIDANFKADPTCGSEVSIVFEPEGSGTRVTLTHGKLEAFGPSADKVVAQLSGGWPTIIQLYADFTAENAQ